MSGRRSLALLIALGVPLLLGGCAKQLQRVELRTEEIAAAQARLELQNRELMSTLTRLDARDQAREDETLQRRADLEAQLLALDRAVRQMEARSQEQESLLRRISAALDLIARGGSGSVGSAGETDASNGGGNDAPAELASPGTDVYNAAFADYTSGRYDLAREGFAEVLQRFPQSQLAPEAAYWWAETYYAEGEHAQARDGFARVIERWSEHRIVPAARLKLAYSLLELGERSRALDVLDQIVRQHPGSDEALIAEHRRNALR